MFLFSMRQSRIRRQGRDMFASESVSSCFIVNCMPNASQKFYSYSIGDNIIMLLSDMILIHARRIVQ